MTANPRSPSPAPLTPETPIGDIVASRPLLAQVFERLQIDYCCGGRQTLGAACAARRLEVAAIIALLEEATVAGARGDAPVDASAWSLTQIADHIERTHHAYVKEELPRLLEMAERVAAKHSWRDSRLPRVVAAVHELTVEMLDHMRKEEAVLFPLIRRLEAGDLPASPGGSIAAPIRRMEAEHASTGQAVSELSLLTDGFTPDAEACNTHRGLLTGLARFEVDLHQHVHLENNLLFPRALALG